MYEFKRLFTPPPLIPEEELDAALLEVWFAEKLIKRECLWMCGIPYIKKNILLQRGPNKLRNKSRINAALSYLEGGYWRARHVKIDKVSYVELNHQYFNELIRDRYPQMQCADVYVYQQNTSHLNYIPNGLDSALIPASVTLTQRY